MFNARLSIRGEVVFSMFGWRDRAVRNEASGSLSAVFEVNRAAFGRFAINPIAYKVSDRCVQAVRSCRRLRLARSSLPSSKYQHELGLHNSIFSKPANQAGHAVLLVPRRSKGV